MAVIKRNQGGAVPSDKPRPRFKTKEKPAPAPASPEALFGELPRTPTGVGALWSHQADLLRTYHEKHATTLDVALELPTGSGKTLVGLLIAEWRRRTYSHRVVYACPTKQLANQVHEAASDQQIPAVLLVGPSRDFEPADLARYTSGKSIAITTYSHIFNVNSKLSDAQTLLFDDAHAAEGYVAEAWALTIPSADAAYDHLLDSLRNELDPHLVARMTSADPGVRSRDDVWLMPVSAVNKQIEQIDQVLATELEFPASMNFQMLRPGLRSCLFYLAPDRWYIRPFIPPTFDHPAFTEPTQRIYLSATLGESGELERAFGRSPIDRIPVPPAWQRTGSGRRFFVFPELADISDDESVDGLAKEILDIADKRLVLTPDNRTAKMVSDHLDLPKGEKFVAKDEAGLRPFLEASRGTLFAPNRYDGMDLSGDACRMLLLTGHPDIVHPQDRFMVSKLRAKRVLEERIRTRITQGAGRCTRGPKDWSVVMVVGPDLVRFLCAREVQQALPVELQAEISFGLNTSEVPASDLVELSRSAFLQDDVWQEDAEPDIAERRRDATKTPPPDAAHLRASAGKEVSAWRAAWRNDWDAAARAAYEVYERLTSSDLRPYRALWAYLASAWSALAAGQGVEGAAERAESLLRVAHKAASRATWLREVQPLPVAEVASDPLDDAGVASILALLAGGLKSATKFDAVSAEMLSRLARNDAAHYEQALVTLGKLVGAEAYKPEGKGRADAVWVWPSLWVTLEAKSESLAEGELSLEYVRKANTHLDSLRGDREEDIPDGSVSIIVSPRRVVDPDAVPVAAQNLYLAPPSHLLDVAQDVVRAWKQIRIELQGSTEAVQVQGASSILWGYRALPAQVIERLTVDPIRSA